MRRTGGEQEEIREGGEQEENGRRQEKENVGGNKGEWEGQEPNIRRKA